MKGWGGSRSILEVPRTDQTRKKWALEAQQNAIQKKTWQIMIVQKHCEKQDPPFRPNVWGVLHVFKKSKHDKNRKTQQIRRSKSMLFLDFGILLGGQKSSKMETFSKHEKHEKSMAGTANLRLEAVQKSITIVCDKIRTWTIKHAKNRKSMNT